MNATVELNALVPQVVANVFATMLSMEAKPEAGSLLKGECVSGTIGIEGEELSGAVYLHFTEALAKKAAAAMLGLSEETVAMELVNDVASELANMIGGGLKSALADQGWPCAMSTPSIVRGPAFAVELPEESQCETFQFTSQGETLAVEIHLKRA